MAHVRERAAEDNGKGIWPLWLNGVGVGRTIGTGRSVEHPEPHPESERTTSEAVAPRGQVPHPGNCQDRWRTTHHRLSQMRVHQINGEVPLEVVWAARGWSVVFAGDESAVRREQPRNKVRWEITSFFLGTSDYPSRQTWSSGPFLVSGSESEMKQV